MALKQAWLGALLAISGACVEEYDPAVFIVLPDVPNACATIGAARARVEVDTVEGERFTVIADGCRPRIAGQDVAGFELVVERVTYGYHRAATVIEDPGGAELGRVEQPFRADAPLVVPFSYADLPAWPTTPLALVMRACPAATVRLAITPTLAARPALDADVPCGAMTVEVPRGPATIEAQADCAVARADVFIAAADPVFPTEALTLDFAPLGCP